MRLPERLEYIFSLCKESKLTVDVGTDHGKLPAKLVLSGVAQKAVASDINPKPLSKADALIKELGISHLIDAVLTDGLRGLSEYKPDQIIIAGMGGELIRDILKADPWVKDPSVRLILQPMTTSPELRAYLFEEGFDIQHDGAVLEGEKPYEVIVAVYDGKKREYTFLDVELGVAKVETPAQRALLLKKRGSAEKRLIGARISNSEDKCNLEEMISYINYCLEDK